MIFVKALALLFVGSWADDSEQTTLLQARMENGLGDVHITKMNTSHQEAHQEAGYSLKYRNGYCGGNWGIARKQLCSTTDVDVCAQQAQVDAECSNDFYIVPHLKQCRCVLKGQTCNKVDFNGGMIYAWSEEPKAQSLEDLLGESKCPIVIGFTVPREVYGWFTRNGVEYFNTGIGLSLVSNRWVRSGRGSMIYKNVDGTYMYYLDGRWQIGPRAGCSTPTTDKSFRSELTSAKCPDNLKWEAYTRPGLGLGLQWTDVFEIKSHKSISEGSETGYWVKFTNMRKSTAIVDCMADWAVLRGIQEGSYFARAFCDLKPSTKASKTYEKISERCADWPDAGGFLIDSRSTTCPGAKQFCNDEGKNGNFVKGACPVTCGGCDGPIEFRTHGMDGAYKKVCPEGTGVKEYNSGTLYCGNPEPTPSDAKAYWATGGRLDSWARCKFGYVATKVFTAGGNMRRRLYCVPW